MVDASLPHSNSYICNEEVDFSTLNCGLKMVSVGSGLAQPDVGPIQVEPDPTLTINR